jgi:hypothetical protein
MFFPIILFPVFLFPYCSSLLVQQSIHHNNLVPLNIKFSCILLSFSPFSVVPSFLANCFTTLNLPLHKLRISLFEICSKNVTLFRMSAVPCILVPCTLVPVHLFPVRGSLCYFTLLYVESRTLALRIFEFQSSSKEVLLYVTVPVAHTPVPYLLLS